MDNIASPKFLNSSISNIGDKTPFVVATQKPQASTQTTQPIDQGALTLSRSIALQESSKDGQTPNYTASGDAGTSYGAYQWNNGKQPLTPGQLPKNFTDAAKKYGLDPNDFSPVNQDKVAYAQVKEMKDQGLQPEQIAAAWNAGMGHINDWQNHKGTTEINGQMVNYDTPGYVKKVQGYYQQLAQNNPQTQQDQPQQTPQQDSPSVGGFLGNVVKSGANFVGNLGEAVLHPIQTAQNLGGTALGGIEKLGGQENENTQKFDNLTSFFKERYGSVDKLLHTAYTDPVGLAADVSAVFGVGGGIANAVGKVGELGDIGEASQLSNAAKIAKAGGADFVVNEAGTTASTAEKILNPAQEIGKTLSKGSELTNPLTPMVKGAGALLNKTKNLSDIIANPQNYTPENIANSTSEKIASDVQETFNKNRADLSDTGSGYNSFKGSPTPIQTTPDALDNILRDTLKLDVTDGIIKPTSTSLLRDSTGISKLQNLYNTYKSDFLNNSMDSEKFLNLRSDLAKVAFNDLGVKNTETAQMAAKVRGVFNDTFREQVSGLKSLDSQYESKINKINELEDGLVYKTGSNKGEIKSSFLNKASKALKTGDDEQLSQLEEIVPGITKRLQVMKTMKDLGNPSFTSSLIEKGGLGASLFTGNIKGAALAFTTIILQKPEIAVPLMRAVGANLELVKSLMANLAKFTTLSAVEQNAVSTQQPDQSQQSQTLQTEQPQQSPPQDNQSQGSQNVSLDKLANDKNFDLDAARKAGYSDKEIQDFLETQK